MVGLLGGGRCGSRVVMMSSVSAIMSAVAAVMSAASTMSTMSGIWIWIRRWGRWIVAGIGVRRSRVR